MKRILIPFFWVFVGALFLFAGYFVVSKKPVFSFSTANINFPGSETFSEENFLIDKSKSEQIILMAVGDMMFDRGVKYMVDKYGAGDFNFVFKNIKSELGKVDILFGNLEGPISNKGLKVGSIYSFEFSPTTTLALKNAGFDVLSLANNHMLDYQAIALQDTMARLQELGIDFVGAGNNADEAFGLKIKEIQGVKIGFLAYENLGPVNWKAQENKTGMAWIGWSDFENLKQQISQAKSQVDVLAVSLHAGQEYWQTPDEFQKEFAKMAIDSGADLIIGHHSHVVQGLEKYNNGWISYSLGNFVFDQYFSKATMQGAILKAQIQNKKITNVVLEKVQLNKYYQPGLSQ